MTSAALPSIPIRAAHQISIRVGMRASRTAVSSALAGYSDLPGSRIGSRRPAHSIDGTRTHGPEGTASPPAVDSTGHSQHPRGTGTTDGSRRSGTSSTRSARAAQGLLTSPSRSQPTKQQNHGVAHQIDVDVPYYAGDPSPRPRQTKDGDPADPGGFLTGERIYMFRTWSTPRRTLRKSGAR